MKFARTIAGVTAVTALSGACGSPEQAAPAPMPTLQSNNLLEFNPTPQTGYSSADCIRTPYYWAATYVDDDPMDKETTTEAFTLGTIGMINEQGALIFSLGAVIVGKGNLEYQVTTSNDNSGESQTINLETGAFSQLIEAESGEPYAAVLTGRLENGMAHFVLNCLPDNSLHPDQDQMPPNTAQIIPPTVLERPTTTTTLSEPV